MCLLLGVFYVAGACMLPAPVSAQRYFIKKNTHQEQSGENEKPVSKNSYFSKFRRSAKEGYFSKFRTKPGITPDIKQERRSTGRTRQERRASSRSGPLNINVELVKIKQRTEAGLPPAVGRWGHILPT
jgi:hypothetical protein